MQSLHPTGKLFKIKTFINMKKISKVIGILILLASCYQAPSNEMAYDEQPQQPDLQNHPYEEEHQKKYGKAIPAKMKMDDSPIQNLKIIKTAEYRFQVKDINLSTKKVQDAVAEYASYISGMNMTVNGYQKNNQISIRVPNSNFNKLLNTIGQEAEFVDYKKINTEDISEEYVDIETRLKTKKEVKERYVDMLRNSAKSMEQVFHAEEKIRQLQEEIEAKEGRLRFLKDKVAFSTIKLEIYQVVDLEAMAAAQEHGFSDDFKDNFINGWSAIMSIVLAMVNIWPIILIGLMVLFWKRDFLSKILNRKRA
jgi:hypothetical protein